MEYYMEWVYMLHRKEIQIIENYFKNMSVKSIAAIKEH